MMIIMMIVHDDHHDDVHDDVHDDADVDVFSFMVLVNDHTVHYVVPSATS